MSPQKAKFDWTNWRERDTTNEWDIFSFLASHGVFLFGTEAYLRAPLAPSSPTLPPFLPTRDQDFVYRHRHAHIGASFITLLCCNLEISHVLSASTLPNGG